jgi:uncharacterized protein
LGGLAQSLTLCETEEFMSAITKSALVILIIGGFNWLLVGLFNLDLVAKLFGGGSALSRIVYILVGVCALYCLGLVFAPRTDINRAAVRTHTN